MKMKTRANSEISDQEESINVNDLETESLTSPEKSDKIEETITCSPDFKSIEIQTDESELHYKFNEAEKEEKRSSDKINIDMFDAFYEDYLEFKNYVNDLFNNKFSCEIGKENARDTQDKEKVNETEAKMKEIEECNKILMEENRDLKDECKSLLNIIKSLSSQQQHHAVDKILEKTQAKAQITPQKFQNYLTEESNQIDFKFEKDTKPRNNRKGKEKSKTSNEMYQLEDTSDELVDVYDNISKFNSYEYQNDLLYHEENLKQDKASKKSADITLSENIPPRVVPGNRTYASTVKYGKKVLLIGDSHIRGIKRNLFDNSMNHAKSYIKSHSGAKAWQLAYHIIPALIEQKPDIAIIHIGSNDISYKNLNIDLNELANQIGDIGRTCHQYGVQEIVISSIFAKKGLRLTAKIRQVNDFLKEICLLHNFHYIENNNITVDDLSDDGVHLSDEGNFVFAGNFIDYLNDYILTDISI